MGLTPNVDYLAYEKIAQIARNFLKQNRIDCIPIPIEKIVEFNFDIDIIPMPELQKIANTEGFITSDFSCIYVDEFVYHQRYFRYRFTLAHELGHLILHKKYYNEHSFNNINEWKKFIKQIDPNDYSKVEYQGYAFAGLVLAPSRELRGIKRTDYIGYGIDTMAKILSQIFEVSTGVITRRIEKDALERDFP